ncbi:MAG: type II secretion system F family protein [Ruminococcus sp.]|nr:type II secretion system F family protein [Ruminococcus sp.]
MPNYKYRATEMSGKTVRGIMAASDPEALLDALKQKDLFLLDYSQMTRISFGSKLKSAELTDFCRQLGTLLNAGVSVIQAFNIISNRSSISKFAKKCFTEITTSLKHGKSLSEAMAEQGKVFPELLISMVRAGEASGKIGETFITMGTHFQKQQRIKSQVKGALAYPCVLLVLLVLVIIVLFTFVIPMFGDMFTDMELPLATRILMSISDFLTTKWYIAVAVVAVIVFAVVMLMRNLASRLAIDKMIISIPKIGPLVKIVYTASFSRTLASLYTSGLSILNAIQISRDTVNNSYLRSQFDDCIKNIRIGNSLSESIQKMDGFDSKLGDTVKVGEETGKLDAMLIATADDYEYESSAAIKSMMSIIEPLMIVVLGVVVAVVMVSVLVPMYSMYGNIDENYGAIQVIQNLFSHLMR